tara:strand:+ start:795 stop:944 length:150 start_codon:yes stop_codon:yes gene_type:complete
MNVDGFTYESWYNMPIHLRTYYTAVIEQKADEQIELQKKTMSNIPKRNK